MPEPAPAVQVLRGMVPTISAGVLAADLLNLGSDIALLEKAGIKILHFDVMDGCFCPVLTAGPVLVKAVKTPLLKDVHLMIQDPLPKLEAYAAAGADMITVHIEACENPRNVLQAMGRMAGAGGKDGRPLRGMALNPVTPLSAIEPLLDDLEMVVLLAVVPGLSGQKFADSTGRKVEELARMVGKSGKDIFIGLDGGITKDNITDVARMGADVVVTGSAIFDKKNIIENARYMLDAVKNGRRS